MAERPKTSQARRTRERRRTILALLIMVAGLLTFLSILFYSREDDAVVSKLSFVDVLRLPFSDEVKQLATDLHNRLGLLGALVSDVFVNVSFGYASCLIPVLAVLWGWVLFRRKETSLWATLTNYAVILMVLFSVAMGLSSLLLGGPGKEWSGLAGAFLADLSTKLLGRVGAPIVILVALFLTGVLAVDLDLQKSFERFRSFGRFLLGLLERRAVRTTPPVQAREEEEGAGPDEDYRREEPAAPEVEIRPVREEPSGHAELEEPVSQEEPVYPELSESPGEPRGPARDEVPQSEEQAGTEEIDYIFPSLELLDPPRQAEGIPEEELKANAELVKSKLANFGLEIQSVGVTPGPVVTLYELVPASDVKISRIVSLADDLALALAAKGIRIIAPIPGKSAVGVEIPNKHPSLVYMRSVLNSAKFRESRAALPIAFGKTIAGEVYTDDLARMPHLLMAGSTGSGKSVGINAILASLLFRMHPSDVKFIIIDPKKIELSSYSRLRHHFLAVSPDIDEEIVTTPTNAVYVLKSVEMEVERRLDMLAKAAVRNIQDYNERWKAGRLKNTDTIIHRKMPYLIVVIDELADLMLTAAGEVEEPIARLAQLARAVGIHLVLATQRPSVDVITGVIKANFPARIAYQVASKVDSRTILDINGAEQLLGTGDMLYIPPGPPKPLRIQNAFISSDEVDRVTEHIASQQGYSAPYRLPSILEARQSGVRGGAGMRDENFLDAARLIVRHQQGSVSLLQRRLKVGYSRAGRLMDELEAAGIVGPFDGSKPREVLVETEEQLEDLLGKL